MTGNTVEKGKEKTAMTGTPCQIMAASLMDNYLEDLPIDLKIGLFCMENFSYNYLKELLKKYDLDLKDVVECRVEKGKMWFYLTEDQIFSIPLSEAKSCMRKSCQICMDFTSEQADISVGSVGSPDGWSTIIVRNEKGLDILEKAEKENYIETKPVSDSGIKLIERLALKKKSENLEEIKKRENIGRPVLSWRIMPEEKYTDEVAENQFSDLKGDVIDIGACVLCGACLLACPENIVEIKDRKPEIKGSCPEGCNACYIACPRTYVPDSISNRDTEKSAFGEYIKIVSAKAPMFQGQDGGIVTALLSYALSENIVDNALVVDKSSQNPWKPKAKLVNNLEAIVKASGTKYSACPIFKSLKE
ncbi:Coenzyme F420 hydrogenase/dehydrogenase, beta subunit C-terminal domain [Methanobacterium alcaliphilum]|uniref:Coenzyme F420 hydrogenase/dehydrogenase, beta subunit C-terminal domain n=1 Tax=Methanobacterium alcaliphilum TaxID=392018 RepID=UPI00200B0F8F|nr:Coenzyme F420 hydrogenase/dehydrogenase, beta subunit C-terminal domain [Methanobacterium alcaliphilum]MCK9151614.1 Coenzyme F420 hydrogenase/dehydrogenase, beta subunit C-terminal domain [Methanobacterium alcaliphilum]